MSVADIVKARFENREFRDGSGRVYRVTEISVLTPSEPIIFVTYSEGEPRKETVSIGYLLGSKPMPRYHLPRTSNQKSR